MKTRLHMLFGIAIFMLFCGLNASEARADDVRIVAAGSTALLPLVKAVTERYGQTHPHVRISVSGGGSGAGLTQVALGAVDIGDSDIPAPPHTGLLDHRVAVVGFAIIAHPDVRVQDLSESQLRAIFSGQISNWREVGGPDLTIVVVNRPRSSGTRMVFRRAIMGTVPIADSSLTVDASGTVVQTVETTPGALSYVALPAVVRAAVHIIRINGRQPLRSLIIAGRYPLWAYEHMFTVQTARREVESFIDTVARDRETIEAQGYIPVSAMRITRSDR